MTVDDLPEPMRVLIASFPMPPPMRITKVENEECFIASWLNIDSYFEVESDNGVITITHHDLLNDQFRHWGISNI